MDTLTSADGTRIAYERVGDGPPLIVVGGALCDRARLRPLCAALGAHLTVFNYDRRGRGDSGEGEGHDVERELDDMAALVAAAGGSAAVYSRRPVATTTSSGRSSPPDATAMRSPCSCG